MRDCKCRFPVTHTFRSQCKFPPPYQELNMHFYFFCSSNKLNFLWRSSNSIPVFGYLEIMPAKCRSFHTITAVLQNTHTFILRPSLYYYCNQPAEELFSFHLSSQKSITLYSGNSYSCPLSIETFDAFVLLIETN